MPRRIRDKAAERVLFERTDIQTRIYRRISPDEEGRAEKYPVYKAGLRTFSHFGIGIGIYFTQLLILALIFFIGAIIMIPAMNAYNTTNYGVQEPLVFISSITAACQNPSSINVTIGCSNSESCTAELRQNCDLPVVAGLVDLILSMFIIFALGVAKLLERNIEKELDEAIQTPQDYSIVVNDPEPDADNPDEWYAFFSRFGTVRYVTVTRKNSQLCAMVITKHKITRKLKDVAKMSDGSKEKNKLQMKYLRKYDEINKKLQKAYQQSYPTCKIYVTFDAEEQKKLCIRELEVPDIQAMLNLRGNTPKRYIFRSASVLDVHEPPEPDSILWENLEIHPSIRLVCTLVTYILCATLLIALFFVLDEISKQSDYVFAVCVGILDTILPIMFAIFGNMSKPQSEGQRLNTLQLLLFGARLLLSTIFPYIQTPWNVFLDEDVLLSTITLQLSACFVSPLVNLFDVAGVVKRQIIAPLQADTQAEMNQMFSGSDWSLAERYTVLAKIIFISLFYALVTPFSLVIALIAFIAVFFIDRYLLLRKWKPTSLFGAAIAGRLRQQTILAIALHMYVTYRFIYSWPMDSAYLNENNEYEKVDKFPPYAIFLFGGVQDWHTDNQQRVLPFYRAGLFVVAVFAIILWIIVPLCRMFRKLFCYVIKVVGDSQGIPFSSLPKISAYVPITTTPDHEKFIISYTSDMLAKNRPSFIRANPEDRDDLSYYVPSQFQPHVLSIVKYYGNAQDSSSDLALLEKGNLHESEEKTGVGYRIVSSKIGNLEKIPNSLPEDLERIVRGKVLSERLIEDEFDSIPYGDKSDGTLETAQASPSPVKLNEAERRYLKTKSSRRISRHRNVSRTTPLPGISSEVKDNDKDAEDDFAFTGDMERDDEAIARINKNGRVKLKPLTYASE